MQLDPFLQPLSPTGWFPVCWLCWGLQAKRESPEVHGLIHEARVQSNNSPNRGTSLQEEAIPCVWMSYACSTPSTPNLKHELQDSTGLQQNPVYEDCIFPCKRLPPALQALLVMFVITAQPLNGIQSPKSPSRRVVSSAHGILPLAPPPTPYS